MRQTSVAMTAAVESALVDHLIRDDSQEDICVAIYRISNGLERSTALIGKTLLPAPGDRIVHGNATITADYILRAADVAASNGCGLAIIHSHPVRLGGSR